MQRTPADLHVTLEPSGDGTHTVITGTDLARAAPATLALASASIVPLVLLGFPAMFLATVLLTLLAPALGLRFRLVVGAQHIAFERTLLGVRYESRSFPLDARAELVPAEAPHLLLYPERTARALCDIVREAIDHSVRRATVRADRKTPYRG